MSSLRDLIEGARFPHPYYEQAIRAAVGHMTFMPPGSVIAMVGPTRVGKSAAIREAAKQTYPGGSDDTSPFVISDCSRTDGGFTSTRYLTIDLLNKLEHAFYGEDVPRIRISQTETNARLQLRRAIHHRSARLLIFDEAHHLLRVKNRAGREAVLESLKCLGNETGALIFLVGGYELLKSCFCSAHLNGRLSLIEFPRYQSEEPEIHHFDRILASFDELLPWAKGHSLLDMREFVYAGTLGCCGLVSKWILIAAAEMWASGASKLRKEHFQRGRYERQIEEIADDIVFGENVLRPVQRPSNNDRDRSQADPKTKKGPGRRPGRRNPTRDKVGERELP